MLRLFLSTFTFITFLVVLFYFNFHLLFSALIPCHLPNSSDSLALLAAQNSSVEAIGAHGATW